MKVEIPNAYGVGTVLTTATPVPFLAREIARFPAFGGVYNYRGTTTPVSLVDAGGVEGGRIMFASLNPTPGYDFGSFAYATVQGRAAIDNGDGTTTPLVGQPITLQVVVEESGPDSGEGSGNGGENGAGGPPAGMGEGVKLPVTIYTDADGNYRFTGLGPGNYTVVSPLASPLTRTVPTGADAAYTIAPMTSGASLIRDFTATFTAGMLNTSTAPAPYPVATHVIVPNFRLGPTEVANTPGEPSVGDGVVFQSAVAEGTVVPIDVSVVGPSSGALLNVWLDLNGDGQWSDGEHMLTDVPVAPGANALTLTIPAGLSLPAGGLPTYARFRLSTQPGLTADGQAADGEVEDEAVRIYSPADLGEIYGRATEDVNGDGLVGADEVGMDGWTAALVSLDTGRVVASQTTGATIDVGGVPTKVDGLYHFVNVIPGVYEVRLAPPTDASWLVTAPGNEEGTLVYRFQVGAGQTVGAPPSGTTPVSSTNLGDLAGRTDTMFVLGQFTIPAAAAVKAVRVKRVGRRAPTPPGRSRSR
ncbi:MAG: GEVED domain-containing protein [Isosphaeraceae bacterium]